VLDKPLCIDLFCGLGGWAEGFLAEGWDVIGFDIERHDYGTGGYPGHLVLQDVLTLHGSQFRNAAVIVASPPCQAYSYRAMPWKRAKALPPPSNELFDACFRIQQEASEAAGRHIALVVENVRGAVKWVTQPVRWHFGSFYLWGDVPPLMPITFRGVHGSAARAEGRKVPGIKLSDVGFDVAAARRYEEGVKQGGSGAAWFDKAVDERRKRTPEMIRQHIGHSRKAASAQIAKIPFSLARWIAQVYYPQRRETSVRDETETAPTHLS
jgi:hypothetical protein